MNDKVQIRLWQVRERVSRLHLRWAMASLAAVILMVGVALYLMGRESLLWQRQFFFGLIAFCAAWILIARITVKRYGPSSQKLAKLVEARFPDLKQALLTAVDPQVRLWGNPLLTRETREKSLQHAQENKWAKIISIKQKLTLAAVNLLLLAGFGVLAFLITTRPASGRLNTLVPPVNKIPDGMKVDPGTIEVERGSSVTISASFGNMTPLDVQLVTKLKSDAPTAGQQDADTSHAQDDRQTSLSMRKALQDPIYSQLVSDIRQDLDYTVMFDGSKSDDYHITVFDYPELVRSDATMIYPSYTGLEESRVENTKRVRMVEGTKLKWQLYLNKPVSVCELIDESGKAIGSVASQEDPQLRIVEMSPAQTVKLKLNLKDEAGRAAKLDTYLYVTVTPNLPPVIKLTAGADKSVSPLEEWAAGADISDDFGVVKHGISYNFRDQDFDVAVDQSNSKKVSVQNQFNMESLQSVPDDLLTYWFWAEDYDAEGNLRRTASDLYFAETRPFEEIFRQGQSQSQSQQQQQQQGGGAARQAEELLQLQKQIVSATWNIRRRVGESEDLQNMDIDTVVNSQTSAIEQLQELQGELQDSASLQDAQTAAQAMKKALEQLTAARSDNPNKNLGDALTSEQQAYQALLKLRAREHEISMSQQQQSQSGGASGQQRQRQIDQLQLEQDENRYETQSEASEPQEQKGSEQQREIQNRLKELAQRQSDLNEQIRQLEAALEQAQTEKEKRDAQEQLKRLREAQEELLRDTDELLEQMNEQQDQNQALQQAAEQTEQSRQSLQQATENLREGQTSEALSAGTRAQQSLDKTQEDLRKNSAEGLNDSLRDLRSKANEMVQQQQEVQEQMQSRQGDEKSAGLRSDSSKEQLQEQIKQQRDKLKELQQSLQDTVLQAEQTEPLVADSLYNTFQQSQRERLDEKLEAQSILMDRALPDEALKFAGQSLDQMQQMQQQIDAAASDVLGSELADLERAASELERLRDQIGREIGEDRSRQQNSANNSNAQDSESQQDSANGGRQQNQEQASGEQGQDQQQSENGDKTDAQQQQSGQPRQRNQEGANQQQQSQSQQPGTQSSEQAGEQNGSSQQQQNDSQQQESNQQGGGGQQAQPNQQQGNAQQQANNQQRGQRNNRGDRNQGGASGGGGLIDQLNEMAQDQAQAVDRPLTGDAFRQFNDALRDVGQLLENRDDAALAEDIRQSARQMRSEYRRHSKPPERDLVNKLIVAPLDELIDRVGLELQRKRAGSSALVPLDNDPVPPGYDRAVRVYYENLGTGQ